ncbi:MAG: aspartate-semialdehyde dehydrogenase, partial [cyanobacterium endosymbiont of Rhopalodia yunnanensis]
MDKPVRVAILGATGAVGTELLNLLEHRDFPVASLKLLASERSVGNSLTFKGETLLVEAVTQNSFRDIDLVLASAGKATSKTWAKSIIESGAVMVDNSSAFRMEREVPLIVPEINPEMAKYHQGIIANPNSTTILMGIAIYPLHRVQPIKRIVVSTYQSASGAGARAMEEVKVQSQAILNGHPPQTEIFPYPLAFNLFPHNSPLNHEGYCTEEMKMVNETRKIFNDPNLRVTATCVRVPVLRAHSEAVNLEFSAQFSAIDARTIIANSPGIKLVEDWTENYFPMPIDASGR